VRGGLAAVPVASIGLLEDGARAPHSGVAAALLCCAAPVFALACGKTPARASPAAFSIAPALLVCSSTCSVAPEAAAPHTLPAAAERALCNRCGTCLENLHFHCPAMLAGDGDEEEQCGADLCPACARSAATRHANHDRDIPQSRCSPQRRRMSSLWVARAGWGEAAPPTRAAETACLLHSWPHTGNSGSSGAAPRPCSAPAAAAQ
jgi:hypothetical protein